MLIESKPRKGGSRETCTELLWNAQNYLKALLDRKLPDTLVATAWDDFYGMYDDLIRRFVVSLGVPRCDVDDCVQEVWCEVASRLVEFNRPADRPGLRAWLYALVRSKATNVFRKKARQSCESLDERMSVGLEPEGNADDPSERYEQRWKQAMLESVIEQLRSELSPTNQRILQLRIVERREVADVAAELSVDAEQVYVRQHRILKKLRTRLAHYTGRPLGELRTK